MFKEFKEFAVKGNMVDMAVGIIIGAAFGSIIKSLVADVIMPPIGILMGGVDFANLFVVVKGPEGVMFETVKAAEEAGAVLIKYGVFFNNIISFLIVALSVFMIVKQINKLKKAPAPADPTTKSCPECVNKIPLAAKKCGFCASVVSA